MYKLISAAILLMLAFVTQCFAQTNIGVQQNCTSQLMCCIPGKGCFSPNTPTGYTCNNGSVRNVTTCTKLPNKAKH